MTFCVLKNVRRVERELDAPLVTSQPSRESEAVSHCRASSSTASPRTRPGVGAERNSAAMSYTGLSLHASALIGGAQ
jgi:hypothetical protein